MTEWQRKHDEAEEPERLQEGVPAVRESVQEDVHTEMSKRWHRFQIYKDLPNQTIKFSQIQTRSLEQILEEIPKNSQKDIAHWKCGKGPMKNNRLSSARHAVDGPMRLRNP
ncbi:hypothetical protein B0H10DRAFT_1953112 [Mycena sp. CBHHK59/15]|nr:hypothetical protein B0H10DRAFT_1953112 [Mycena sp. CBHHK59/15]